MKRLLTSVIAAVTIQFAISQTVNLNIKIFIEGPYFNGLMTPSLNALGHLPTNQPYNVAPWYYNGTESVTIIPSPDIVDWVIVDVLKPYFTGNQTWFEVIGRKAGFLFNDGFIKDMDGIGNLSIQSTMTSGFYIRIHHRNHLPVISAVPLIESGGVFSYDFAFSADQALGETLSQKQLSAEIWGMIAADANASGQIDNIDKNEFWLLQQGLTGYFEGDFNMDSQVETDDKLEKWEPNAGKQSYSVKDTITIFGVWICGDSIHDIRDNKNYSTVLIGNQCWMAENLNFGLMIPGINDMADNSVFEKYCFDNNASDCDTYGGLYQWNEMMQYSTQQGTSGICPPIDGWHIPTDSELLTITDYLGGESNAGGGMKQTGTIQGSDGLWNEPNEGATNSSGFTGLPGGYRRYDGLFYFQGYYTHFWSSSEATSANAVTRTLFYNYPDFYLNNFSKDYGFSVRCVKDLTINLPPAEPFNPQPPDGALNQQIIDTLSWMCTDPENDALSFDVYFGISNPPALVSVAQTNNTYIPDTLAFNTDYYWMIVAHDDHGNQIDGPVWTFTTIAEPLWICGNPFVDDRDGQVYKTAQINNQCWMTQNLNFGSMISATVNMENDSIIEKYCYDNDTANCDIYGGLYQWSEIMQYSTNTGVQGICPAGWHIPTDLEWTLLTNYLGGANVAGGKLKEDGFAHWIPPNVDATNESAFTGLPGGMCDYYFDGIGVTGAWWTSTRDPWDLKKSYHPIRISLNTYNAKASRYIAYDSYGLSVRCLNDEPAPGLPTVTTSFIYNISESSASGGGSVSTQGNSDVMERGICWSTAQYPTTSDPHTTDGTGTGPFTSEITGLSNNTIYYVRAYATNNESTAYGNMVSFYAQSGGGGGEPCPAVPTIVYENQVYNTVQIGTQCWFRENLNVGVRVNGHNGQINNGVIEKDCYYHEPGYCEIYGGLYHWDEMMQYSTTPGAQGICPSGWHIPTNAEWTTLFDYLDGASVAGGKMKETGFANWIAPNTGASNLSGFTGLPGGKFDEYYFSYLGEYGLWWSSNIETPINKPLKLSATSAGIVVANPLSGWGCSVRCLKDE